MFSPLKSVGGRSSLGGRPPLYNPAKKRIYTVKNILNKEGAINPQLCIY